MPKPLKTKNFVYELVEHVDSKKEPNLELILTHYVEGWGSTAILNFSKVSHYITKLNTNFFSGIIGIGMKGDVVTVRPHFGRQKLLMQGLAVYASPENLKKFADQKSSGDRQELKHSSRFSELVFHQTNWNITVFNCYNIFSDKERACSPSLVCSS